MSMVQIQILGLIACRVFSFMAVAPVLSERNFPNLCKLILGGSLVMSAFSMAAAFESEVSAGVFLLMAVRETVFGLAMGYLCRLLFFGVMMTGQLIDFQDGFIMAQAYDPTMQTSTSQFGKLFYWLAVMVFFATGLYRQMIRGLMISFDIVSLGYPTLTGDSIGGIVRLFTRMFEMSFNMGAPVIISILVIDVVLGILSRSIPQLNVLMLSLNVKTTVSFIICMLILPNLVDFLADNISDMIQNMADFIRSIA